MGAWKSCDVRYFYPRSPCGERLAYPDMIICTNVISIHALLAESDGLGVGLYLMTEISIHALLAESDYRAPPYNLMIHQFLSTLSLRRATDYEQYYIHAPGISIHALLAESDFCQFRGVLFVGNFYPRSPCGERRPMDVPQYQILDISIHALLAESDWRG